MIKVSENAYRQILDAMEKADASSLGLRLAARKGEGGDFEYIMGFDEVKPDDVVTREREVTIMYAPDMDELLSGTTLEFDVIDEGSEPQFIFLNPNDPSFVPPAEE